jgi:hypothetical protein
VLNKEHLVPEGLAKIRALTLLINKNTLKKKA